MVSMQTMIDNVVKNAGETEEFNHRFFHRVKDMVNAGDADAIHKEKIPLKLMRLNPACQDGFIMTDFPKDIAEAEQLDDHVPKQHEIERGYSRKCPLKHI